MALPPLVLSCFLPGFAGGGVFGDCALPGGSGIPPYAYVDPTVTVVPWVFADNGGSNTWMSPSDAIATGQNVYGWTTAGGEGFSAVATLSFTASAGAPAAFDLSQLDPTTMTAYLAWGFFIIAMGMLPLWGIKMFLKFLRAA